MTKNKIDFTKAKVYKIVGSDPNDKCYVGSTTKEYLSQRMTAHVASYKTWKVDPTIKGKMMSYDLFDKYGVSNCKIILLELCKDITCRDELRAREQHYMDSLDCVNHHRALVTPDQLKADDKIYDQRTYAKHRDRILAKSNQYYLDNAEVVKAKRAEVIHCDICDCETTKGHLSRHNKSTKHRDNAERIKTV